MSGRRQRRLRRTWRGPARARCDQGQDDGDRSSHCRGRYRPGTRERSGGADFPRSRPHCHTLLVALTACQLQPVRAAADAASRSPINRSVTSPSTRDSGTSSTSPTPTTARCRRSGTAVRCGAPTARSTGEHRTRRRRARAEHGRRRDRVLRWLPTARVPRIRSAAVEFTTGGGTRACPRSSSTLVVRRPGADGRRLRSAVCSPLLVSGRDCLGTAALSRR